MIVHGTLLPFWHGLIGLLVLLTGVGCVFHLVSILAGAIYVRRKVRTSDGLQPVSVLKPLRGVDEEAFENFASFCRQDYPEYEILFGVQDPADPAIPVVQRLQREFPGVSIRLVVSDRRIGTNLKVCNLQNLLEEAAHELVVISDSDMRVEPSYLREIAAYFADPQVGLVTSPYRGAHVRSLAAGLEALGMATDFFPGVAVASQFAPPAFALGSTLAFTRETLREIGGFEDLADYLADDFQLGHRVARAGKRVVLSRYVVDTVLPNAGLWPMFTRRLRWTRTARICQPAGFAGSAVTYSTFWALALVVLAGFQPWALGILATQQAVRLATAAVLGCGILESPGLATWLILLPVSDVLNFVLWVGSWFGNTVLWRGDRYRLTGGGRMVRLTGETVTSSTLLGGTPPG